MRSCRRSSPMPVFSSTIARMGRSIAIRETKAVRHSRSIPLAIAMTSTASVAPPASNSIKTCGTHGATRISPGFANRHALRRSALHGDARDGRDSRGRQRGHPEVKSRTRSLSGGQEIEGFVWVLEAMNGKRRAVARFLSGGAVEVELLPLKGCTGPGIHLVRCERRPGRRPLDLIAPDPAPQLDQV